MMKADADAIKGLLELEHLPELPALIRYVDPFSDSYCTIHSPSESDKWLLHVNGRQECLDFKEFPLSVRFLAKLALSWSILRYSPNSVFFQYKTLVWIVDNIPNQLFSAPFVCRPIEFKRLWHNVILLKLIEGRRRSTYVKMYLYFLCDNALGCFNTGYEDFVSVLPGPKEDLYASIRTGDSFLAPVEEISIISYIDDLCELAKTGSIDPLRLRNACVLICSYQHATRPIQIAKVKQSDVLVRLSNQETFDGPIVHIRFHREKQSSGDEKVALLRKIKREWAILFVRFAAVRNDEKAFKVELGSLEDSFFGLTPYQVSQCITTATGSFLASRRSATDFRHTAAQRMADAGASHEEIQELLGHNNKRTALRYFSGSATQAERVNKALVVSPIYSEVAEIHRSKTIDMAKLLKLPDDQQVGAIAHGIPIAGIGGCELGQSMCSKNPVLSCYGCRKFLPVRDVAKHEYVRDTLRPVVKQFYEASHGDVETPAYTQWRHTISVVQQVIADLGAGETQ